MAKTAVKKVAPKKVVAKHKPKFEIETSEISKGNATIKIEFLGGTRYKIDVDNCQLEHMFRAIDILQSDIKEILAQKK